MTTGANVPEAQTGADAALEVADGLRDLADDFDTLCEETHTLLSGEPEVTGMNDFQVEYKSYMDSVQSQADDIADNIHGAAGEIGGTDEENQDDLRCYPHLPPID
ncbi:hypothetical protein IDM40_19800 [Nocardiopsis sp. HNM0947]|uniref:Uncharacterized protein n=1 Tax=Nocardiopsis coralli TaxID=2772213 RepID=A0ABR9PAP8_9ACTN|nr:hypothetical protein [Nocardiopsis coralli]MBE3000918.1 hypothetical protein [Nocardiopsis coralli]